MARRFTTRFSTATFARSNHEAALLSGDGQPLYRAEKLAGRRDAGDCRRPAGGFRLQGRRGWSRYRPCLPQARPFQGGDDRAARGERGGVRELRERNPPSPWAWLVPAIHAFLV